MKCKSEDLKKMADQIFSVWKPSLFSILLVLARALEEDKEMGCGASRGVVADSQVAKASAKPAGGESGAFRGIEVEESGDMFVTSALTQKSSTTMLPESSVASADDRSTVCADSETIEPVLYFMRKGCINCFRVHLAAILLEIEIEVFEMDFDNIMPAWFLATNPKGDLPAISHNGTTICEVSAIIEYLDELGAERRVPRERRIRLFPKNIGARSRVRSFIATFETELVRIVTEATASSDKSDETLKAVDANMRKLLEDIETKYAASVGPYMFGSDLTAADLTVASVFAIAHVYHNQPERDFRMKFPHIDRAYTDLLDKISKLGKELPSIFTIEDHLRFVYRHAHVGCGSVYHQIFTKSKVLLPRKSFVPENNHLPGIDSVMRDDEWGRRRSSLLMEESSPCVTASAAPVDQRVEVAYAPPPSATAVVMTEGVSADFAAYSSSPASSYFGEGEENTIVVCASTNTTEHRGLGKDMQRRFTLLRHDSIGQGAYGAVFKAFDLLHGRYAAVKEAKVPKTAKQAKQLVADTRAEFNALVHLQHPNIVAVIALELDKKFARIYMEWMPAGSIAAVVKNAGPLQEPIVRRYVVNVLSALAYVHAKGVVHRDVKPANMLVSSDGTVKLSDFGTATLLAAVGESDQGGGSRAVGTVPYMSPDVLNGLVDASNDLWAVALSVYEMLSGKIPWSETGLNGVQLMYHISKLTEAPDAMIHSLAISSELKSAMSECLALDRHKRPSACELLARAYFQDERGSPM